MARLEIATVVIPTIGRPQLAHALASLGAQACERWRAVVVGDGAPMIPIPYREQGSYDGAVQFINAPHTASAGLTRDYGIDRALDWPAVWVAFLDDDDQLLPGYVDRLRHYYDPESPPFRSPDIIVFRMQYSNGSILPPWGDDRIQWGRVGISFAVRQSWLANHPDVRFGRENLASPGPDGNEDIRFLRRAQEAGADVHVDDSIQYLVRPL